MSPPCAILDLTNNRGAKTKLLSQIARSFSRVRAPVNLNSLRSCNLGLPVILASGATSMSPHIFNVFRIGKILQVREIVVQLIAIYMVDRKTKTRSDKCFCKKSMKVEDRTFVVLPQVYDAIPARPNNGSFDISLRFVADFSTAANFIGRAGRDGNKIGHENAVDRVCSKYNGPRYADGKYHEKLARAMK